jgi:hypothetical protein
VCFGIVENVNIYSIYIESSAIFTLKMLVLFETPAGYAIFKVCESTINHFVSFDCCVLVKVNLKRCESDIILSHGFSDEEFVSKSA